MTNKIYIYNFQHPHSSGWNTEQATNIRSARKQARERWKAESPTHDLMPNEKTFKRISYEELSRLYAMWD